jgi:cellulose synthase/poly-beta-1,6-N-acetylglucosamine synthase-like glycosyltransferase
MDHGSAWIALFWACVALLAYVYAGYPALVWLRAARSRRGAHAAPAPTATEPTVSVLLVAHDEADRIAARIENLLALDYPRDRLEIIVASDGSSDATVARACAYLGEGVDVVAFEGQRGKAATINEVVPKARGEIVVFADARQRFDRDTVRALVRPFAVPEIGAVSGELMLADEVGGTVGRGVGFYWRYEKLIRRSESRLDSTVGATGAVYAIRRALFEPIPDDTILDDVLIPLRVVRRGYRVLFEPAARAHDQVAATARQEFARKVRTLAGNFQLFRRETWLLNPWRNRIWLAAVSHKGLRLATPILHVGAFLASGALADAVFYACAFAGQAVFYGAALGGHLLRHRTRRSAFLSVPYVLCLLNWATIVGFVRYAGGRQGATWERPRA